jgi:uncharacterized protein
LDALNESLPVPTPTVLTQGFWESAKKGKLVFQYCSKCNTLQAYPKPWCSECGSEELSWKEMSGEGTVYSFTIPRQVVDNSLAFKDKLPFIIAVIELKEGPKFISNIIDLPPDNVRIGMKVRVTFEEFREEIVLPTFRPCKGNSRSEMANVVDR